MKETIYLKAREKAGLSREAAAARMNGISKERIQRIEGGEFEAHPDEVLQMSDAYHMPELCNQYCASICAIGQKNVPLIRMKELSQIVLEILSSLNAMEKKQERLIDITVDGKIEKEEVEDFVRIQEELERISICTETMKLWLEQVIMAGKIDMEDYKRYRTRG